jgi:hypothetical protein
LAEQSRWNAIEWLSTGAGDGTIPERSAVHPNAAGKYPFAANHGDIYANPAALEFLKWELVDKYSVVSKELVSTPGLTINFEPDKDVYAPGETIHAWATVHANDPGTSPVVGARVNVQTLWRQALPGSHAPTAPPAPSAAVALREVVDNPGRYEASLAAPETEGYYRLSATVQANDETVTLGEMIAVEAE